MKVAPLPANESKRLKKLREYEILDTLSESSYDEITQIASEICQTPIALVSLVDKDRQWFKSNHGLEARETHRDFSFCAHAILNPNELFIVDDTLANPDFADNPLVTGNPYIRFYAGAPLITPTGEVLGSLCVIDKKPRTLTASQKASLKALANQVVAKMELKAKIKELNALQLELKNSNLLLNQFATIVAHDLQSPLLGIRTTSRIIKNKQNRELDEDEWQAIGSINDSADFCIKLIENILNYSKAGSVKNEHPQKVLLKTLINEIIHSLTPHETIHLETDLHENEILIQKTGLQQILHNLLSNAIKYSDKESASIKIKVTDLESHFEFSVSDNGPGIDPKNHHMLFDEFKILKNSDKYNKKGTGIGLSTVKKLVEDLGGTIKVKSKVKKGTEFIFTLKKPDANIVFPNNQCTSA